MTLRPTKQRMPSHGAPTPNPWRAALPLLALLLVSCAHGAPTNGEAPIATRVATPIPTAMTRTPEPAPTSTVPPAPDGSAILTLCTDAAAYHANNGYSSRFVRAATYDGPIDIVAHRLHPTLLQKLPSLADGDAVIAPVSVRAGDLVLDAAGLPVRLAPDVTVRPAGCRAAGCARTVRKADLAPNATMPFEMDQITVTFRLNTTAWTWADGTPLTAADSVRGFEITETLNGEGPHAILKLGTAHYRAIDDEQVLWVGLPGYLPAAYPQAFWTPQREETRSAQPGSAQPGASLPLGYGPYTPVEWEAEQPALGQALRLSRNPYYVTPDGTRPAFDEVRIAFWPSASASPVEAGVLAALENGACDLLTPDLNLEPALPHLKALEQAGTARIIPQPVAAWEHLTFNVAATPPIFGDVRTRQAVAYCLDREALISEATHGYGLLLDTYLPPTHPLAETVTPYPYIPDRGATLLNQAGWIDHDGDGVREAVAVPGVPDGTHLRVRYVTTTASVSSTGAPGPDREGVARQVTAMLRVCGIEVDAVALPPWEFYAQHQTSPLISGAFDMAQFAWPAELVPPCELYITGAIPAAPPAHKILGTPGATHAVTDTTVIESPVIRHGWRGTNIGAFSDAAYDAVCSQAIWALPGEPGYESAHRHAQRLFAAMLPALPLYQDVTFLAARPGLQGLLPDPAAVITWNLERFE